MYVLYRFTKSQLLFADPRLDSRALFVEPRAQNTLSTHLAFPTSAAQWGLNPDWEHIPSTSGVEMPIC